MWVVLAPDQEAVLLQMAADLDESPDVLLGLLVSDRLEASSDLSLWRE
ncbi:MAG TPA: hypothetical protein VLS51_00170 [Propionibacteriaceae bacterium]|nr:hypothetical protein [Propionibacteriaceae bacterium]